MIAKMDLSNTNRYRYSHNKTILIVEDNMINLKIAKIMIEELGYTNIISAATGEQAISLFSDILDLVLLDIGLPDINGQQVCRMMRNMQIKKHIPIIAYTSNNDISRKECLEAGMDDFAIKPMTSHQFKGLITYWLEIFSNQFLKY